MKLTGKKVLVTGADGFIGSHLTEMLVRAGAMVRAMSYYNSFNHWGWLEEVDCLSQIEVVTGDIRDADSCRAATKGVDVVMHLAALIAIPYSYSAPGSFVETNVRGTLNLCQAARESGCSRVVHTSTSEVYGTARYVPIDEAHPLQPQSPYSASKIGADMIASSFYHSYGLPVVIARPFNTYGPRQSARAVIPTIISQIAAGKNEIDLGDLSPTREFNFVPDTCRGFLALAECDTAIGETVNLGSNQEISVGELFDLIRRLMGSEAKAVLQPERVRPSASEVRRLRCDNAKLLKLNGQVPLVPLEEGLRRTITWFREPRNLAKYKTNLYNV